MEALTFVKRYNSVRSEERAEEIDSDSQDATPDETAGIFIPLRSQVP